MRKAVLMIQDTVKRVRRVRVTMLEIMIQCMKNVKFSETEIREVLDCVVAILNIGNVEFAEKD